MTARELWQWAVDNGAEDIPLWAADVDTTDPRDAWRPLGVYQPACIDEMDMDWWSHEAEEYGDGKIEKVVAL